MPWQQRLIGRQEVVIYLTIQDNNKVNQVKNKVIQVNNKVIQVNNKVIEIRSKQQSNPGK